MSQYNYVKNVTHSATFKETDAIRCNAADMSSTFSSTLTETELNCEGLAKALSDHASTLVIDRLTSAEADLTATYSSTLIVNHIECENVNIHADFSSTLKILGGRIGTINGSVMNASTGIHKNVTLAQDNVQVGPGCTWGTGFLSATATKGNK